jgi:DNA-directed RNA polymerase specialized sigma24 family protein
MEPSTSDDTAFAGFMRRVRAGDEQAARELVERYEPVIRREAKMLADLRGQGYEWAEIAARVGGTPQARRMQLARAVRRVERQLEGCEAGHE